MKKIYLLTIVLLSSFWGFSQITFPYSENFDTYIAGDKFVEQVSSTVWTTWDNNPGSATDPEVSNAQSNSAPNSIKIGASNDLVFVPGDLIEGRYSITFKMYIPNGKLAYFNMLQEFNGSNSKWGYQILFNDGVATVQGAGEVKYNYTADTWFDLKTIIDLDTDWCEIYFDGNLIFEFKWSVGTSNTNLKQFAAIDFYGWDNSGQGTPEFYFDDLSMKEVQSPEAPQNLTAEI
jgi:hypothetical protein